MPTLVQTFEGMRVLQAACGWLHTVFLVDTSNGTEIVRPRQQIGTDLGLSLPSSNLLFLFFLMIISQCII